MAPRVKVSNQFKIAVPAEARQKLGIKRGDHLVVDIRDGCMLLIPEPANYSRQLRGLHRDVWADVEPQEYVRRERGAW